MKTPGEQMMAISFLKDEVARLERERDEWRSRFESAARSLTASEEDRENAERERDEARAQCERDRDASRETAAQIGWREALSISPLTWLAQHARKTESAWREWDAEHSRAERAEARVKELEAALIRIRDDVDYHGHPTGRSSSAILSEIAAEAMRRRS